MTVDIDKIEYKFVPREEMIKLLDKIEFMEHNKFYNRKEVEKHLDDDSVEYCIQFYGKVPLSISVMKFDSFGDNDATCLELQSVVPGYCLYFMDHLITDPKVMRNKDIWFCVDHSNPLCGRLLKFYSVFKTRYDLKEVDIIRNGKMFTFFYSYPCSDEERELNHFMSFI